MRLISRSATTVAIMAGSVSNPPIVSRVNLTHLTRAQFDPFTRRRGGKPFYFIRTLKSHRGFTKGEICFFFPTLPQFVGNRRFLDWERQQFSGTERSARR